MKIGAIFPQTEIGTDLGAIRAFVQAVEEMGYDSIFVADHVLGADPQFHQHPSLARYSYKSVVHEPLTLLAYMAAVSVRLTLSTGILILPQRQTALVAKQAAELDLLSGGRLRLGIGVGWNAVEYEALGQDFHNRGRRCEEQIAVLRALWTQEVVDFQGRWHRIRHAGLNPLPVQRPIPIWLGVGSLRGSRPPQAVLRRVACMADGWCPNIPTNEEGQAIVAQVHRYAKEAGRDPSNLPLEGRVMIGGRSPEDWVKQVQAWQRLGAEQFLAEARGGGLAFPEGHLAAMRQFKKVLEG
ncbi:MAG TPA: LLM class F420-dependent oxidoreductase [Alphaproteobacteria bacterium]|nr:LLM class F420-dependent oxidoreductase [Alphaproteobacteria bacterium]